jgi:hypothetical protein
MEKFGKIVLYQTSLDKPALRIQMDKESLWLTQEQIAELFGKSKSTINEHIHNIYDENELSREDTMRKFGNSEFSTKPTNFYHLDVVVAVGYRVKSSQGTRFRQWATQRLSEYLVKGFTMDDERLKNLGGGNFFKELLERIRDIRSSEKVMYRQVLDLYATATDYDPKSKVSLEFFKIVQNKLHYAAHGNTASEVIYFRVDSDKPFAGLSNFKGKEPTQAEAMIAKNYLNEQELRILNNLVSAYFDIAELNAIEEQEMKMKDFVRELDGILSSTRRKILDNAGKISHSQAENKAKIEFKKYKAKTLDDVEKEYLQAINALEKQAKKGKK